MSRSSWRRNCPGRTCVCTSGITFWLLFTSAARWRCRLMFEIELGAPVASKLSRGFCRAAEQDTGSQRKWSRWKRGGAESCSATHYSIAPSALWFLICCFTSDFGSWSTVPPAVAFADSFVNRSRDTAGASWATDRRKEPGLGSATCCICRAWSKRFWNTCKCTSIAEG